VAWENWYPRSAAAGMPYQYTFHQDSHLGWESGFLVHVDMISGPRSGAGDPAAFAWLAE